MRSDQTQAEGDLRPLPGADALNNFHSRVGYLAKVLACVFIDALFLSAWLFVQDIVQLLAKKIELSGLDSWLLLVWRIVFALSTLVPVVLYIYEDLMVMRIRVAKRLEEEKQNVKKDRANDESQ